MQDDTDQMAGPTPAPADAEVARARGMLWWLGWTLGFLSLAALALAGGLWLRLTMGPLTLPETLRDRIEARIDDGMAAGRLQIGEVALDLPEGGRAPVLEFRNLRLSDRSGAPRAAFPAVRVLIDPAPLLSGQVRPRRVEIAGAGLRLSRDGAGRFDLDLSGAASPARVTVPDTMARLDAMFSSPVFDALQEVTATGLQLSLADEMTGQIMRIESATARLTRSGGQLALTVGGALSGSRDTILDIAVLRSAGNGETEIATVFRDLAARDLATASPALGWLDPVRAPISGRLALSLFDDGTVGDLEARLDIGAGRVSLAENAAPLEFDRIAADMVYDPDTRRIAFSAFRLDAPGLAFDAAGHADVAPDGSSFVTQFRLSDIEVGPAGLYPEPLRIEGATVDLRLTLAPQLSVELGEAVLHDGAFRVVARGRASAEATGLAVAVDASVAETDFATVLSYWPVSVVPETREWIERNIARGRLSGVDFAVRARPGMPLLRHLQADFDGLEMTPLRQGPPVRGASGYLELDGPGLMLRLDGGVMSAGGDGAPGIDLGGSLMEVADVTRRGPDARFRIEGRGGLQALLGVLEGPPFRVFRDSELEIDRIGTGDVALTTTFTSRLERRDTPATLAELGLEGRAEVSGFASDGLVPGRQLSAERLTVSLDPELLRVSGPADLSGVPLAGTFERPIGPDAPRASRLQARAPLTREGLARLGVALPDWLMSGQGAADVVLDMPDGAPARLSVESDLDGLAMSVPALGWRIGQGTTGRLSAEIMLGPEPEVTALDLDAPGLSLDAGATLLPGGGLARLTAARLVAGEWVDVQGALVGRGPGIAPAIEITGGTVSLDRAPELSSGAGEGTAPLSVRLDRLEVSRGIALTGLSGSFDTGGGGLQGEFRAAVNGEAEIAGAILRGANGPDIRIQSEDGGAVLRAAGIFRTAYGGRMTLGLQSAGPRRTYDGTLRIDGPRLRDAPAMAELLNLISVVGLLEQLSGEGINLGTVDARFRLSPDRLTLAEGTAVGPSLGISMDGIYDIPTRRYEMQGVVSPLYMVNGLVGAFFAPRREGLFGFSYRLTGVGDQSNVAVNPLSILTPGIFREIFRRPPPELTETPSN